MKQVFKGMFIVMLFGLVVTSTQVFSGGGKSETEEKVEDKSDGSTNINWSGRAKNAPGTKSGNIVGRMEGEFTVADRDGAAKYRIPIKTVAGFRGMNPNLALSYQTANSQTHYGVGWGLSGLPSLSRCGANSTVSGLKRWTEDYSCTKSRRVNYNCTKYRRVLRGRWVRGHCTRRSWGVCKSYHYYYQKYWANQGYTARCTKTENYTATCQREKSSKYVNRAVSYNNLDRLCYQGQQLILKSGTLNRGGSEYRLANDRWMKAKLRGKYSGWDKNCSLSSALMANCKVEVTAKNGTVTTFWPKGDKRQFFPTIIRDLVGNEQIIKWKDLGTREVVLDAVEYTSNGRAGRNASRQVAFHYEKRDDKTYKYAGGHRHNMFHRLKQVNIRHKVNGSWKTHNIYHLKYKRGRTTQRTLLSSVQMCDDGNNCLAATKFDYTDGAKNTKPLGGRVQSWMRYSGSNSPEGKKMSIRMMADVNGDGLQDMAYVQNPKDGRDRVCTAYSTGKAFGTPKCRDAMIESQKKGEPFTMSDTNGDGKSDFVYFSTEHTYLSNHAALVNRGGDNGFGNWKRWGKSQNFIYTENVTGRSEKDRKKRKWDTNYHTRHTQDVNNDGRMDILGFGPDHVQVSLADKNGNMQAPTNWYSGFTKNNGGWQEDKFPRLLGDVNGDGLPDIVGFGEAGVYVALNDGKKFVDAGTWSRAMTYNLEWRTDNHPRHLADWNGDGMMDLVGFGYNGVEVHLSTGKTFTQIVRQGDNNKFGSGNWQISEEPRIVQDINGDGMADIIGFQGDGNVVVALSTGMGMKTIDKWHTSTTFTDKTDWTGENNPRFLSDVNGDGLPDLVGYGNHEMFVVINSGGDAGMGVGPDNLYKITDGYGDPITVEYATVPHGTKGLRKSGRYQHHGSAPKWPHVRVKSSSAPIVKSTTVRNSNTNDGTAKEVVTDYSWFNFTINKNGLGSEGFGKVQSVNRETGSKLIKEYYLSFPLSNYQSKRRLYDGDNNLLSQEDFQYTSLKGTWEKANLFERKPSYVGTWNGANARNQRYTLYDDNGLPYVIKDQGSNTGDAHIYRCRKHRVNTNLWIIDFVTEERVMRYDPTSGYGCRFGQGFNDGIDLQLTKTSEWYGFPRIQQEWDNIGKRWNRTDYHYGSSGETERVVDPNGNSTYYGYDRGRDGHMVTNRIQNALGHVIHKSYHWSGGVETQSFSNGKENTFHYDNFGRMTKAFGPHPTEGHQVLMKKILYEHPGGGKGVLKLTNFVRKDWGGDPNEINTNFHTGIFTSEYLDNLGNKIREEKNLLGDGQNQVSESIYNSVGQTTREYVPYLRGNSRGKYRQLHFAKGSPNLTKIVDHTGHVTKIRYGSGGMETWQTVPSPSGDGETTVYMKKSLKGNTLTKITPAGITNFTYDGIGNLKQIQDPTGARNYVYYNSVGSVYKQSRPDTGTERMWYDTNGNLTKKQNGAGEVTTISYDKLNRIVRSQNSVGFQAYTYDNGHPNAKGRLTKIRYPGNNYEEFTYDNTGKTVVSKVTIEGTSFVSKTEYGPQGGVDRYTFPNGKVQNNNHRRGYIKSVDFDGSRMATVNSINVNGSATETELGNGDVISQRYDSFFRMLGTSVRNGGRLQFSESIAYDNRTGKVIFVSRGDLGVKGFYKYDNLGRLNNARYAKGSIWNQKNISHESYTFDRNYNLTSVNNTQFNLVNNQVRSVSGDKSINYSYDRAGRMTHKSKGGFSQSFGYDPTSSKLNYIKTNGKETKFFFAGDGRTLRRLDHDGRSVVSPFGSFEVATHKNGSVTHTMRVFGFGKVIAAITEDGQPSLVNRHIIHNTYKLSAGMMDTNTLIGAYGWAKNKFAQLLSRPDLANELLKGFSLAFAVGVLFFMIYGIVRTRLRGKVHWWHYPVLVVFFTVSMTVPVFAGIQPGANGAGQPTIGTLYFHTDHLGSTGATTDENGNSKSKVLYNSYGEVVEEHSSGKDNFREKFLGKEYDKGTGLTYMGARAFDNDIRRFISPDPAHQMESPYRYAADPIAKADPNGNFIFTLIAIIVGALITGFVLAGSIAGTFNPLKWDAKVWGYFFAGAIVGALFGAFAAWAAPAAIASAGVASGSWAAFGITAAITFGVGIAQAMVIGAIKQGGLIDTGKQDSFNVHDWGMGVLMEGVVAGAAGIGVGALFKGAGQGFSAAWKAIKKVAVPGRSGWLGKAVGFVTKVGNSKAWNKLQAFTGQMSAKTAKAQDNLAAFNKIADGAGFTQAMASKTMQNIRLAGKITRATWSVVGVSVKVGCGYTGGCSNSRGWAMGFVGGFLGGSSGFGMVMENLIQAGVGAASHAATGGHCGTFAGNMTSMNAGAMCDY